MAKEGGKQVDAENLLYALGADKTMVDKFFYTEPETPYIEKPVWKTVTDALWLGTRSIAHQSWGAIQNVLPDLIQAASIEYDPMMQAKPSPERVQQILDETAPIVENLRQRYFKHQEEWTKWLEANKNLQPNPKYNESVFDNPEMFKDAGWWAYQIAQSMPYTLGTMAVTLGVSALGGPAAGLMAGGAFIFPSQFEDVYQDLIASGATDREAKGIAPSIAMAISGLEVGSDLPVLSAISPAFKGLTGKVRKELADRTVKALVKKGLRTAGGQILSEVITEELQQILQNTIASEFDENREIFAGLDDIAIKTVVATTPMAIFGGGMSMRAVDTKTAQETSEARRIKEGWTKDEASGTWYKPEKLVDIYNKVFDEIKGTGATDEVASWKALNEVARSEEGAQSIADFYATLTGKVPETAQVLAGAEARLGQPAKILTKLSTPEETTKLKTLQEEGKKKGLDIEAVDGIAPGEYWLSITRNTKDKTEFTNWLIELRNQNPDTANKIEKALSGKFEFKETEPAWGRGKFLPFKTLTDAENFIKTGDMNFASKGIQLRGQTWTPEHLRETQEAIKADETRRVQPPTETEIVGKPPVVPPETPTVETGQAIAKELGIKFDGIQEVDKRLGEPDKMQFTDSQTGSTTYGNTLEEVRAKIDEMRQKFATAEAAQPEGELTPGEVASIEELQATETYLKDKIQSRSDYFNNQIREIRDNFRNKIKTADEVKQTLNDIARDTPREVKAQMLTAMKDIKTEADLDAALIKLGEISEKYTQKVLVAEVGKELARTPAKKVSGVLKGKFTAETQPLLDALRSDLKLTFEKATEVRDEARNKIAENIQAFNDGKMSVEAMRQSNDMLQLAGIKGMTSTELTAALDSIRKLKGEALDDRAIAEIERNERLDPIKTGIIDNSSGGKGLKPGGETIGPEAVNKQFTKGTAWFELLKNRQLSLASLLEKISKYSKTLPHGSVASTFSDPVVFKASAEQHKGAMRAFNNVVEGVKSIYGVKTGGEVNHILTDLTHEKFNLGTFKNTEGTEVKLEYTKGQIIKMYMLMKDPSLAETFNEGMKWTQEIKDAFNNSLNAKEKALGDFIMDFYQKEYDAINEVYKKVFHVDLPKNDYYSPGFREFEKDTPEMSLLYRDLTRYSSTLNGSLKSRVANIRPLKLNDAIWELKNHIIQMEHFKAWTEPMADLRSVFGDKGVRDSITQYHGTDIMGQLDHTLNKLARGGMEASQKVSLIDKARANFAVAVIGLNPRQLIQQLPTLLSWHTQMNTADFFSGVADFWKNPVANYRWLRENSDYIKERYEAGIERDIALNKNLNAVQQFTHSGNVRDWAFYLMNQGDRFGVIAGYWAKYKAELKVNGGDTAKALVEAGLAADRAQNTSQIYTLSSWQTQSSWMKVLTMFQSQPNKYYQLISENARNFQYGRGSRLKAAGNIVLAWVVLPMLFQLIGDGFDWKNKHQLRAVVLGPINDLLVVGQMAQTIESWFTGEFFDYQVSPILGIMTDFMKAAQKGYSNVGKILSDGEKEISPDDIITFVEHLAKVMGETLGVPTPYLIQVEKAIRAGNPKELIWTKYMLKPEAPDVNQKAEDAENLLGQLIPASVEKAKKVEETIQKTGGAVKTKPTPGVKVIGEITAPKPEIQTMSKMDSDFRKIYDGVNPKDILADKKSLSMAKAWAEKEIAAQELNILPNVKLTDIPDYANKLQGGLIELRDLYIQRTKIDNMKKLKEFDDFYGTLPFKGNLTNRQIELIAAYAGTPDADKKKYLAKLSEEDRKTLTSNPQEEWLKSHPNENALMAVFGDENLYSKKAYEKAYELVRTLDIPDLALRLKNDKSLPPFAIADDFFKHQKTTDEFGFNSYESDLELAKNDALREYLHPDMTAQEVKDLKAKVPVLELQVKNRPLQKQIESYSDKESDSYLDDKIKDMNGKTARDRARDKLHADNPEYQRDLWRIEAMQKGATGKVDLGQFGKGNIDLTNRPQVKNPDGTISTVRSISFEEDGKEILIPTVSEDGEILSNQEAINLYHQTGKYLGKFNSIDEANQYAQQLHEQQSGKTQVDRWVEVGDLGKKYSPNSAEVKAWFLDNPEVHRWALDNKLRDDEGEKWNERVIRIDVKYRDKDKEYEAIPDVGTARVDFLQKPENKEYRLDRRRREMWGQKDNLPTAWKTNISLAQPKMTEQLVESYVKFWEIPTAGYRRERYLIEHPELHAFMHQVKGNSIVDPSKVPDVEYDNIYDRNKKMFDSYDSFGDVKSKSYIENQGERDRARDSLLVSNPNFGKEYYRRRAYGEFFDKKLVENYADYYQLLSKGKPPQQDEWYDDDWYLMEHPEFYKAIKTTKEWKTKDFRNVPTREEFTKYQAYDNPNLSSAQKETMRRNDTVLDDYLVQKKHYTPLKVELPEKRIEREGLPLYNQWLRISNYEEKNKFLREHGILQDYLAQINRTGKTPKQPSKADKIRERLLSGARR